MEYLSHQRDPKAPANTYKLRHVYTCIVYDVARGTLSSKFETLITLQSPRFSYMWDKIKLLADSDVNCGTKWIALLSYHCFGFIIFSMKSTFYKSPNKSKNTFYALKAQVLVYLFTKFEDSGYCTNWGERGTFFSQEVLRNPEGRTDNMKAVYPEI